eukprot:TRINITY_DN39061_c0_g1_i1.p1 TRINITY_DN39061_c0_g1~~TRINITY_DN39061_c0_g1_i1.p1  ORF type:complete len:789 (+),score=152.78 TRINITY_DN39061_c0_g1_i1:472-2838(+)
MKSKSSCDVGNIHLQSEVAMQLETPLSENLLNNGLESGVPSSLPQDDPLQKPVKKQTRQWEAWTRQEEENFFNALRQVGKNFDKITCRVQSKNKDQVRYYYYRLVRRMNKLLGPGFCLDAKNPKDTNAAMLRWWSLLEKYSCPASKLRLKPRRFKIFVEALEHQLLKDRKKTKGKRHNQGDCLASPPTSVALVNKAQTNDARSVKLLIVDGPNTQKGRKAPSLKRNVNTSGTCNKIDSTTMKTSRQRRRTGALSSVAYRRWEKAAMAGVSLVADAAEQLERTAIATRDCPDPAIGQMAAHSVSPVTSHGVISHLVKDTSTHPSTKLKLQLFPIDEFTRKALEKDEHNPHLELTLSARKKISSVLEHLTRKWGSSTIASGELMLLPYNIQQGNLASCTKWTLKDTVASAADVYATVGSPAVFRLRYGWFPNGKFRSGTFQSPCAFASGINDCLQSADTGRGRFTNMNAPDGEKMNMDAVLERASPINHLSKLPVESKNQKNPVEKTAAFSVFPDHSNLLVSTEERATSSSWPQEENRDGMGNLRMSNGNMSVGEWADSLLSNISMGDLLSELASRGTDTNCVDPHAPCVQQMPLSCDSFDAAIVAQLSGPRDTPCLTTQVSHASIWDAEETCDAFSFQRASQGVPCLLQSSSLEAGREITSADSLGFHGLVEEFTKNGPTEDLFCRVDPKTGSQCDAHGRDDSSKDFPLADMCWLDSLGPLDLDMPSRYQGQEMILGDSTSVGAGLNRLIASSLDAFHNCSFFGSDKKESLTSEARGATQFSDLKLGEV